MQPIVRKEAVYVTQKRVRSTIVGVEKQLVLHILIVCL
jgi:hypothetical protein